MAALDEPTVRSMPEEALGIMLQKLAADGYELVGPTVIDGAIVYDRIEGVGDLPRGIVDEQSPGGYRLHHRGDAWCGYVVGPRSLKRFTIPREPL